MRDIKEKGSGLTPNVQSLRSKKGGGRFACQMTGRPDKLNRLNKLNKPKA